MALLRHAVTHIAFALGLFAPAFGAQTEVVIPTRDGVEIHGTLHLPEGDILEPIPAVLLVHGGGQSRKEWAPLLPKIEERGLAMLAIDLRGHGATGGEIADWKAFFNDADGVPHDVEAAMGFLQEHDKIRADRIAVVGSSVGGNLACVAVQKFGAIGGVFMSGKTAAARSLAGGELDRLESMLYIAGGKEQGGARARFARELTAMSSGASRLLIVEDSKAHGAALFGEHPELVRDVVDHVAGVLASGQRKRLELRAKDELPVTADLYAPHPVSSPWIVAAHQAGWSRGEYLETAPLWNALGFNVLAVDQRSGKGVNDVPNETAARARDAKLDAGYLDARPDIVAALQWVRELGGERVILVGSSYSASLAVLLGAEHPELIDAVASFSPGEYFRKQDPKVVETAARSLQVPAFITSARGEVDAWRTIYDAIPGDDGTSKWSFTPSVEGQHGSRALWSKFEGHRELRAAFARFLLSQRD